MLLVTGACSPELIGKSYNVNVACLESLQAAFETVPHTLGMVASIVAVYQIWMCPSKVPTRKLIACQPLIL
jgi:hypothetical protein